MSLYSKKFNRAIKEQDKVENIDDPLTDQDAMAAELDPETDPTDFDVETPDAPVPNGQKEMFDELNSWISEMDRFSDYLNGTNDSVQTKLNKAEDDTLFDSISNAETKKINEQSIENIHTLKTGKLIECSVMLGQIGNKDLKEKNLMKSFGDKIGLAFQITDDILEVISNEEALGKNINSDKKNSKATYVNILGLDESIKKSKDLCESAINEIKNIKSGEIDLLIELAKYICYREK